MKKQLESTGRSLALPNHRPRRHTHRHTPPPHSGVKGKKKKKKKNGIHPTCAFVKAKSRTQKRYPPREIPSPHLSPPLLPLTRNNVAAAPAPALHSKTPFRSTSLVCASESEVDSITTLHKVVRQSQKDAAEEGCQGGEDYARETRE